MRKLLVGLTGAFVVVSAASLAEAKVKVFACVPEWATLAAAIGGDRVEVTLATSALDNPETMAPTPGMISALQSADLMICTGAGLEESWLPAMLDKAGNAKVAAGQPGHFMASEFVQLIGDEAAGGHEHHGSAAPHTHMHGDGNPHLHGNPANVRSVAAQFAKRLIEIDPDGKEAYSAAAKGFIKDLGALAKEMEAAAAALKGVHVAVQHEHSLYILKWLGIVTVATVEPTPGVAPGPDHLAAIIEEMPQQDVKFVLYAAYEDPGPSKFVAEKAGVPLIKLPYTIGGTPEATDFQTFYRSTVERLLDGLNGRERS
jgi:zinc/manganese transport system substrate-binding protein